MPSEETPLDEVISALDALTTDELIELLEPPAPTRQQLIERIIQKRGIEFLYEELCAGESEREECARNGAA